MRAAGLNGQILCGLPELTNLYHLRTGSHLVHYLLITVVLFLDILHINARSIKKNSKVANIELSQLKFKFAVIAVTETWTTDDDQSVVFFPGYKMLLKSKNNGSGYGGVALFLNEAIISNSIFKSYPIE